jgi:hypothetical protein
MGRPLGCACREFYGKAVDLRQGCNCVHAVRSMDGQLWVGVALCGWRALCVAAVQIG